MDENFNIHLGKKLRMRRLSLGLTQTKVANAINVTFQQIQKYEKGTNGVSSSRLMQLSSFLKVPVTYFYDDYTNSQTESVDSPEDLNYSFLIKTFGFFNLTTRFNSPGLRCILIFSKSGPPPIIINLIPLILSFMLSNFFIIFSRPENS